MKKLFIILLALPFFSSAQTSDSFKNLHSLQGTWAMKGNRGTIYETWSVNNDSTLAGKSFKITPGGDTMVLEEVTLVERQHSIFYIPVVQGQNDQQAVSFRLVSATNGQYVFDNPEHDFPQRVIYELPKKDYLHAWIEGMDKGSYRKSEFHYRKEN